MSIAMLALVRVPFTCCNLHSRPLLTLLTPLARLRFTLQSGKELEFHAMPIGAIETTIQVIIELVYGRADGVPMGFSVLCGRSLSKRHTKIVSRCQASPSAFPLFKQCCVYSRAATNNPFSALRKLLLSSPVVRARAYLQLRLGVGKWQCLSVSA